jgi:Zn-dependent protease
LDYSTVIAIAVVLASLTVHEAAHAWTADRFGDPTARMLGRVSLNPIVHIDVIGTIVLPVMAALSGLPIIGWAKPVPVNTSRLRSPRRDFVLVAAAGPGSNLAIAAAAAVVLHAIAPETGGRHFAGATGLLSGILYYGVTINVLLAVFNLIPVPPLDGGNVLAGLLPPRFAEMFVLIRPYGFLVLYALMFTGMLSAMILPPAAALIRVLLP